MTEFQFNNNNNNRKYNNNYKNIIITTPTEKSTTTTTQTRPSIKTTTTTTFLGCDSNELNLVYLYRDIFKTETEIFRLYTWDTKTRNSCTKAIVQFSSSISK